MKRSDFNYGQLDKALRSLGFSCRIVNDEPPSTRIYEHAKAGAMIMLPAFPDEDHVFEYHMVAVRTELENFGIADSSVFAARLKKAG